MLQYIISVLSTPIRLHHRISFENMQVGHSPGSLARNCWLPGCASWPVLILQILTLQEAEGMHDEALVQTCKVGRQKCM